MRRLQQPLFGGAKHGLLNGALACEVEARESRACGFHLFKRPPLNGRLVLARREVFRGLADECD